MTRASLRRPQQGFISSWPALAILLVGLMLTGIATYLTQTHQQNSAYAEFIRKSGQAEEQLVRLLGQARLDAELLAMMQPQSAAFQHLAGRSDAILEIYQADNTSLTPVWSESTDMAPEPEHMLTRLKPDQIQRLADAASEAFINQKPKPLQLHAGNEFVTTTGANQLYWLIPTTDGVTLTAFSLTAALAPLTASLQESGIRLDLFDLDRFAADPFMVLNKETGVATTDSPDPEWQLQNPLPLADSQWLARFTPNAAFLSRTDTPLMLIIFLGGTLISALLASVVSGVTQQRQDPQDKQYP